jgi:hypothetical protein
VPRPITTGHRAAWAPASRRAASRSFSRAPGPPARRLAPSSDPHCGRAYKYVELAVNHLCFSVFTATATAAPPLAAAAVEPPPATQIAPASSPRPLAPRGPTGLAVFSPEPPHHHFLCPTPIGAPPPPPPRGQATLAHRRRHQEHHLDRCEPLNVFLALI